MDFAQTIAQTATFKSCGDLEFDGSRIDYLPHKLTSFLTSPDRMKEFQLYLPALTQLNNIFNVKRRYVGTLFNCKPIPSLEL